MSLITNVKEAGCIYRDAALRNLSLPAFCAENIQTIEAVLQAQPPGLVRQALEVTRR